MSVPTPNMNLVLSTIGLDSGLNWEMNLNSSLTTIDQHNHSSGNGAPIQPSGLNINSALTFNNQQVTNLQAALFTDQTTLSTLNALYTKSGELYFNDPTGPVQITLAGSVNATTSGISSGSASAAFASGVLVVNAAANTPANIQLGSAILGNNSAGSNFLTLSPPAAMTASFTLTLPSIPGAQSFLTLDASGNFGTPLALSGGITASNVASHTLTNLQIAANTITTNEISATAGILGSQLANSTIAQAQISTNISLPGKAVSESGNLLVVASFNATNSLAIIRGQVNSGGGLGGGEGFSCINTGTGRYTVTYAIPFTDAAIITATPIGSAGFPQLCQVVSAPSSTGFDLEIYNGSFAYVNSAFSFIAIAQRA